MFEYANTCEHYSTLCFIKQQSVLLTINWEILARFRRCLASIFLSQSDIVWEFGLIGGLKLYSSEKCAILGFYVLFSVELSILQRISVHCYIWLLRILYFARWSVFEYCQQDSNTTFVLHSPRWTYHAPNQWYVFNNSTCIRLLCYRSAPNCSRRSVA